MTPQEAIKRIKHHNELHSRAEKHFAIRITKALNMAVEALEKQIPKKVCEVQKDYIIKHHCCPSCDYPVNVSFIKDRIAGFRKDKYCNNCGQALDWSDAE